MDSSEWFLVTERPINMRFFSNGMRKGRVLSRLEFSSCVFTPLGRVCTVCVVVGYMIYSKRDELRSKFSSFGCEIIYL